MNFPNHNFSNQDENILNPHSIRDENNSLSNIMPPIWQTGIFETTFFPQTGVTSITNNMVNILLQIYI